MAIESRYSRNTIKCGEYFIKQIILYCIRSRTPNTNGTHYKNIICNFNIFLILLYLWLILIHEKSINHI